MLQGSANHKKLLGGIVVASIFAFWILVDFYIFPILDLPSYSLYEVLAYGSWIIITFVCFGILSWAGCLSMGDQSRKPNESTNSVGY
jgi:hypothetical protein